ncbi:MAG: hypothetical protein JHC71_11780 [Blastococcus sp.]|nr:hypothetical protein [Blastococcus sp.]
MPTVDTADASDCAVCGQPWTEVDDGIRWLHLEVTRHDESDRLDFLDADFCSQEHAAEWLRRPLPAPASEPLHTVTSRDRLVDMGFVLLIGLLIALAVLGLWTAGRFVVGLF